MVDKTIDDQKSNTTEDKQSTTYQKSSIQYEVALENANRAINRQEWVLEKSYEHMNRLYIFLMLIVSGYGIVLPYVYDFSVDLSLSEAMLGAIVVLIPFLILMLYIANSRLFKLIPFSPQEMRDVTQSGKLEPNISERLRTLAADAPEDFRIRLKDKADIISINNLNIQYIKRKLAYLYIFITFSVLLSPLAWILSLYI